MQRSSATLFVALVGLAIAPAATASGEGWGLNGTYAAVSNGDLAQTNDVFRNEATVHSTWTIKPPALRQWTAPGGLRATQGGARR